MTVSELIKILSQYDGDMDVIIDDSTDGGFFNIRNLEEWDIQKYGDTKIIFNYKT